RYCYALPGGASGCPLDRPTQSVESKSRSVLSPGPLMDGGDGLVTDQDQVTTSEQAHQWQREPPGMFRYRESQM
ncbi:unnamed protein product, partial [Staurois parvus]